MSKHLSSKHGLVGFMWLAFVCALGCATSEKDPSPSGSGGAAGFGGTGGTGGTSGVGGTSGTGGIGGTGGTSGTGGIGGTGGTSGTGGIGGTGGTGGTAGVGGTGGDGGTGGTGGMTVSNRVAANQVCQRLAEIQCAGEARCCTDNTRKYASDSACITGQRDVCEDVFKISEVGIDSRTGYSMDLAEQALDTFEAKTVACALDAQSWGASADGLLTMFAGTRSSGQTCQPMSETDFAAGLSCNAGLTCVPSSELANIPIGWACRARSNNGGDCFVDVNCVDGLRCTEINSLSTCTTTRGLNESCSRPTECASLFCENNVCADVTIDNVYCLGN